ncbi:hypothetical protein C8R44DRAFT_945843 [Mycena epipterygia]|nr:hypothetical protein C8R44DRAFT_945843 [Mycena epipterygia]
MSPLCRRSPKLATVTVTTALVASPMPGVPCHGRRPVASLHIRTLTRYDIDGPWEMHRDILKGAPNLVQARIYIDFDYEPWPDSGEIIHVLRLQRLFLSDAVILNHHRAPVLQEIVFKGEEAEDTAYLSHLDPFILRSGCTLRRLSFDGTPTTCSVADILKEYPSITELAILIADLGDSERASDLISHLTIPNSNGSATMSPQLAEISFGSYNDHSYIDYILLVRMLQSRWKAKDCALHSAALLTKKLHTGPDVATLRDLDLLRREGLDLLLLQGMDASRIMDSWGYSRSRDNP